MFERVRTWWKRFNAPPAPEPRFNYWPSDKLGEPQTPTQVLAYLCHKHQATHVIFPSPFHVEIGLKYANGRVVTGLGKDAAQAIRDLCARVGYEWTPPRVERTDGN